MLPPNQPIRSRPMRIRGNLKLLGALTLMCGMLGACKPSVVCHAFHPVADAGWRQDDTLDFLFSLPDTMALYAVSVELRHRLDFPYTNLPVSVTIATIADSVLWRDTLFMPVADAQGNWVGRGWGNLRTTSSRPISLSMRQTDTLQLILLPALADSLLPGVNDVGVCVERLGQSLD